MKLHRETLKLIAIITMTMNHAAAALLPAGTPLYMLLTGIGYFTAPVMCRLLADGIRHTSDLRKYKLRLFVFALLSQLPYMAALGIRQPNILFSLLICLYIAEVLDCEPDPAQCYTKLLVLVVICSFCDWSCILPLFMIWLKKCRRERDAWIYMICLQGVFNLLSFMNEPYALPAGPAIGYALGSMAGPAAAALCMLYLYDGRSVFATPSAAPTPEAEAHNTAALSALRKISKWFFYIYYPAHLTVLALLKMRG